MEQIQKTNPNPKKGNNKIPFKYFFFLIISILVIIILLIFFLKTSNVFQQTPDIELIPEATIDFDSLNCTRFLVENPFDYTSSLDVQGDIIDHVLCVTKDIYLKYPLETEESFRKYNIGVNNNNGVG